MLSYPRAAKSHLENQVSICLSTDLPLYFWAHGFRDPARLADYTYLMTTAKRIIIDSASAPSGALGFSWPRPENLRDLAFARLLAVRQSIGQFLSRYPAEAIAGGLVSVTLAHGARLAAEARVLMGWISGRTGECGAHAVEFDVRRLSTLADDGLSLAFAYVGRERVLLGGKRTLPKSSAVFDADFGKGRTTLHATVGLLPEENALSEAMFF